MLRQYAPKRNKSEFMNKPMSVLLIMKSRFRDEPLSVPLVMKSGFTEVPMSVYDYDYDLSSN